MMSVSVAGRPYSEVEIQTEAPENGVRTVTENSLTLKFKTQGFEKE